MRATNAAFALAVWLSVILLLAQTTAALSFWSFVNAKQTAPTQHDAPTATLGSHKQHDKQPQHGQITSLPGYDGPLPSKHYGGYINVGGSRQLYYYLVESERSPADDPVV